jgi:hypothetical protein
MDGTTPLLSVVATSRNDDHGANLLGRMQAFVNAFIGQCKRHGLRAELILVEWNPPADRPPLAQALHWPADPSPCAVRIVQVPEALHRRFAHSEALPLFQMIGKNVGIRRARAPFVLATNIDVLLSDELIAWLKSGNLRPGKVYRIDRTDVDADVPVEGPVEEQLKYCRENLLRVNGVEGIFRLNPDGSRALESDDVVADGDGILFGDDWYEVERGPGAKYRWVGPNPVLWVRRPEGPRRRLLLEIEPGPGVKYRPFDLEIRDESGGFVASGRIPGKSVISLSLPAGAGERRSFRLHAVGGGQPLLTDNRGLDFRVHRVEWCDEAGGAAAFRLHHFESRRFGDVLSTRRTGVRFGDGWGPVERGLFGPFRVAGDGATLQVDPHSAATGTLRLRVGAGKRPLTLQVRDGDGNLLAEREVSRTHQTITVPVPAPALLRLHTGGKELYLHRCAWSRAGLVGTLTAPVRDACSSLWNKAATAVLPGTKLHRLLETRVRRRRGAASYRFVPPRLHLGACGDFTLMARDHWFDLQGYAEFAIYSLHIDSLLCYAAHYSGLTEEVLPAPMCAYHIEHSKGSGWTPEGEKQLLERMAAKGIPVMTLADLYDHAHVMHRERTGRVFDQPDWGFANETLPETRIG